MADATGLDFDEDFALLGQLDGDVFDGPWGSGFFDDDGAAFGWDVWGHCFWLLSR